MIAAGRAESRGLPNLRFYRRPIERFRIPERAFDAAFFSSETFPVMTENRAIVSHLKSVGRLLRRGALYCIDVDRMDGVREIRMRQLWEERTIVVDGATVKVRAVNRPTPWHLGVYSIFDLRCEIRADGRTVRTRDLIPVRYTIPPTLDLLALASGMFTMIAAYSDYSFDAPIEKCDRRWLGVLRRI
jgi:hypothetical protein